MTMIARLPYLYDLIVWPFATYDKTFTYSTGTSLLDKVPVDLTGCHAQLMVRQSARDLAALVAIADVATSVGGITLGGVLGTVRVLFNPLATGLLVGTTPGFQLFLTMTDGSVRPLVSGLVQVQPGYIH